MTHDLKTWPHAFEAVLDGTKTYEIRKADRPFAVGDTLLLREWKPCDGAIGSIGWGDYTGREVTKMVTYLTGGGQWGIPADICVMALAAPERDWKARPASEQEWWDAGHCPMYPGDGPRCEMLEQTSECEDDCNCTSRIVTELGLPAPAADLEIT